MAGTRNQVRGLPAFFPRLRRTRCGTGRSRGPLLYQEAVPIRSRYQGGAYALSQDQVITGQGRAAEGRRRGCRVKRGNPHHAVCRRDVVAAGLARDRPACADVVVQQFQSWRGQVRREPGEADVDVFDVVEVGCSGPQFSVQVPVLNPNTDPKNPVFLGCVADPDGGVIDAEKGPGTVSPAPFSWEALVRKGEQFQRVAVVITELERRHASGAIRQAYRVVAADRPEAPVRHDQLMRVPHVDHDDRHVLEPEVGARAAERVRASAESVNSSSSIRWRPSRSNERRPRACPMHSTRVSAGSMSPRCSTVHPNVRT